MPRKFKKMESTYVAGLEDLKRAQAIANERGSTERPSRGGVKLRVNDPESNRSAFEALKQAEAQERANAMAKLNQELAKSPETPKPEAVHVDLQKLRVSLMNPTKAMSVADIQQFMGDEALRTSLLEDIQRQKADLGRTPTSRIAKERLEILDRQLEAVKSPVETVVSPFLANLRSQRDRMKNLRNQNTEKLNADIDLLEGVLREESARSLAKKAAADQEKARLAAENAAAAAQRAAEEAAAKEAKRLEMQARVKEVIAKSPLYQYQEKKRQAEKARLAEETRRQVEAFERQQAEAAAEAERTKHEEETKLEKEYESKRLTAPAILAKMAIQNLNGGTFDRNGYKKAVDDELDAMFEEATKTKINRYSTVGARMGAMPVEEAVKTRIDTLVQRIRRAGRPGSTDESVPFLPLMERELEQLRGVEAALAKQSAEKAATDALMADGPELNWGEVEDFADQIFQPKKSEAVKELLAAPDDDGPELTLVDETTERSMKSQADITRRGQEFRRRMEEAKTRRAEAATARQAEEEAKKPVPKTEQQVFDEQVAGLEAQLRQKKADYEKRFRMKLVLDRKRVERSQNETGFFASLRRGFGRLTNSDAYQREQALKEYDETQRQLDLLKASLSERQRDWASGDTFSEAASNFFDNYNENEEKEPVDMAEVDRQEMEASFLKVDFQEALASARRGTFNQKQFHSLKERLRTTRQALTDLERRFPSLKKMGTLKLGFEEVRASEEALKDIIALRNPDMGKDVSASDLELPDPLDPRSKPDEHLLRLRRKTAKAPTRKSA
jgi:hypothetical protein